MEQIQYSTSSSEYAQAMRSIRAAKNVFWIVVILAIAVQIASFLLIHCFGIVCNVRMTPGEAVVTSAPTTGPLAVPVASWTDWDSWSQLMHWVLPATMFLGAVASMLLTMAILFAVKIALLGRRPGLATMISAFFWSLILLAAMIPWQQVLPGTFASGALFNLGELKWWESWVDKPTALEYRILVYGRFLVYLGAALLVAVIVQIKFAIASRAISGMPTLSLTTEKPASST